jgi:structural maintenance of chromosome 4
MFTALQLEITQKLEITKRESAENERALDHWRTEHDKLKLYDIE